MVSGGYVSALVSEPADLCPQATHQLQFQNLKQNQNAKKKGNHYKLGLLNFKGQTKVLLLERLIRAVEEVAYRLRQIKTLKRN